MTLRVTEIFHSIQGESTHAGRPCVFVRLTGCKLRCRWCDTAYAFSEGSEMTLDEVVARVESYRCPLVELTGGDPLEQPEAFELTRRLLDAGHEVLIETGGHVDITPVDRRARVILDVKCPGSGMVKAMDWENLRRLWPGCEVKFVILDRGDYDFAREVVQKYDLAEWPLLFSPVHGQLHPRQLAEWMLADGVPAQLQLQVHKFIWDPDARGV